MQFFPKDNQPEKHFALPPFEDLTSWKSAALPTLRLTATTADSAVHLNISEVTLHLI